MSQFSSLLKKGSNLDKLKSAVQSATNGGKNYEDAGYWRLKTDNLGNGTAIIRFLPAPPQESTPFGVFFRHSFQGPNGWYIENSRTSIGEQDPVTDFNSKLWNTKDENYQNQARRQSRKTTFVANIYVVQDKATPENEGKVFLYRFGKKIFDKIEKALTPEFDEDKPFDPFHVLEGANFRLRQKKQANFPNYDDSTFETPKPLLKGDEAALTAVFQELKSISDLTAPDKFKSYDELKKKLDRVMGFDTAVYITPAQAASDTGLRIASSATVPSAPAPTATTATKWTPPPVSVETADDETADRLSAFDDDDPNA